MTEKPLPRQWFGAPDGSLAEHAHKYCQHRDRP
jgi:hypothetical protein